MKTKILYLENSDTAASIMDKMDWAAGSRILMVPPARGETLHGRINLQLIHRHSRSLGSEMALITRDHLLEEHARQIGIPVFHSLRLAEGIFWERAQTAGKEHKPAEERRKWIETTGELVKAIKAKQKAPRSKLGKASFTLGAAAFLGVLVTVLPRAEVSLQPRSSSQEIQIRVRASEDFPTFNLSGDLPVHRTAIIVEGRATTPTSGTIEIAQGTAAGEVEFTNLTGEAVTIPQGTRLISNTGVEAEFATSETVEVGAGAGSTAIATITALNPGESGNAAPGVINVVDGPLGLKVSVSNPMETSGGNNRQGPGPSEKDYSDLDRQLMDSLWQNALDELAGGLSSGDFIISNAPRSEQILSEQFSPETPLASNTLTLHKQIEFEIAWVSWEDIQGMIEGILDGSLPDGYKAAVDTLVVEHLGQPVTDVQGAARWTLKASRSIRSVVEPLEVREQIKGLGFQAAQEKLTRNYALESAAEISIVPSWWPFLPITPIRIQVTTE